MSQRSVAPKHAVYMPRPPLERPAARTHARPLGMTRPLKRAVQGEATSAVRTRSRKVGSPIRVRAAHRVTARPIIAQPVAGRSTPARRQWGAALGVLCPAAILLCALSLSFAGIVLGLAALLGQTLREEAERGSFLLLAGGTVLVLLRGQVGVDRYGSLRRRLGLVSGHWTDHALGVLYALAFFFAVAIVSTLLAAGAALIIGALVHSH